MGGPGDSGARLRVTLLGAFEVSRGGAVVGVPGARLRGLLVRLALAGGRAVGPATLTGALWPEARPAEPGNALQSLVSRLRRLLGSAGAVTQAEGGYRLEVTAADVDALRFEALAATGRGHLRAGDPGAAVAVLGEAVALWGEPTVIAEVAPGVAARLARSAVEAVTGLAGAELALGRAAAAAERLTGLLAEHPADERAAALLIDALAAQGRQAEALAEFERIREQLADRLGADPGAALRERHLRLLRAGSPSPAPEARPGNLPAPLTSFVGRDDDLARIATRLSTGRLVTVIGPGGAGKTRLAVEAARRHRHEYRDGTWLIDLAPVTEPAELTTAVLTGIGSRSTTLFDNPRLRADSDELATLTDQLDGRETLLLVDNCEHLVDAVAHLIATLLPRCTGLHILATSREPLAIDGEHLVPLGPLTPPAAVRLFTERATAVRPDLHTDGTTRTTITHIVHTLDRLPLALELAAARLRTMSLTELSTGLSDRFALLTTGHRTARPRHRTLRAVIAWSWDLLTPPERALAEHIAVLPGGVTAASATALAGGPAVPAADVPALLAGLVDRSLLQLGTEPGRYRMLETVREYGQAELADPDTVRDRAATYFADLTARYDPQLRGPAQLEALRVMRAEYDNTLAALRHLCDRGDGDAAVSLAMKLTWFWQMFGRHADAASWLREALAAPAGRRTLERDCAEAVLLLNRVAARAGPAVRESAEGDLELRALAGRLLAYPSVPGFAGALTAMALYFLRETEAALVVIGRLVDGPDLWVAGLARLFRAQFAENDGDLEQVRVDVAAALDCFARTGDRWGTATALPIRALLRQYDGDLDGALADLREARARARDFGALSLSDEIFIDLRWIDLHLRRGEEDRALAMLDGVREQATRTASPELVVLVDIMAAGVWLRLGEVDRAREVVGRAEAGMARELPFGGDHGEALLGSVQAALCLRLGDPAGAEAALTRAYAAAVESRDMPILSMVAVTAARLAERYGRYRDVALLLGAAARLRGTHDRTDPEIREMTGRGRAAVGPDAFAEAYRDGWHLESRTAAARVDPARLRRELDGPGRVPDGPAPLPDRPGRAPDGPAPGRAQTRRA